MHDESLPITHIEFPNQIIIDSKWMHRQYHYIITVVFFFNKGHNNSSFLFQWRQIGAST
jgi:hypothetical protein